jgi:hypothetical protein
MAENETSGKKETNTSNPPEDDPLLRSEGEIIDKTIGSEGQKLADKRLAALKRAHEMPSA